MRGNTIIDELFMGQLVMHSFTNSQPLSDNIDCFIINQTTPNIIRSSDKNKIIISKNNLTNDVYGRVQSPN